MSEDKLLVDIRALASLARVDIYDAEVVKFEQEIPNILAFVDTIKKLEVSSTSSDTSVRNIMRADDNAHKGGIYTEALLRAAPAREGDRIAVKQVISRRNN